MGYDTKSEIEAHFPALSEHNWRGFKNSTGGDDYLTTRLRRDLQARLVHRKRRYFLYALVPVTRHAG